MTGGRRLFEALCPIFIILVHEKWGDFSAILVSMASYWMPGTNKQYTNRQWMHLDGVCDATWVWRVDRTNMGAFLSESWYLTYPPQNNHFGSKWSHAAQQWQKCVNTTIKWYSITVSIGGWWSLTNMAAYNIRFGCNFLGTKSYGMDRVGCE